MAKTYKHLTLQKSRLYITYGLLFLLLAACKHRDAQIEMLWKNNRAVAIQIPKQLVRDFSETDINNAVRVINPDSKSKANILGSISLDGDNLIFTPLIPLTQDMSYNVFSHDQLLGTVKMRFTSNDTPQLVGIYPEKDTIPENTLKLYLQFSKPMRTGQSLDHVTLLDKNKDTMRNVFLNLQPELWDTSGTVLTLWLDPGRIKRGLVLNQKLGNPLKHAQKYQLIISQQWKDSHGLNLSKNYTKHLAAGDRDAQMPDINTWQLNMPKSGTNEPLIINVRESLDHYLLQEAIQIIDADNQLIKGTISTSHHDQQWQFTPSQAWKAQHYKLRVDAKLEDLAGNNLNRVFDRDLTRDTQRNKDYFERAFDLK